METLASIYTKGTLRKLQKFLGMDSKDPYMKYKEIDFFKELFAKFQPNKCLEYGCGTSTPYYMSHLPDGAQWVSIEHHKGWFDKISKVIDRPNLSLHFSSLSSYNMYLFRVLLILINSLIPISFDTSSILNFK